MLSLQDSLIDMLRSLGRKGEQPSLMLRELVMQIGDEVVDRPLLVRYFSTAFCLTDGQGYKIFGWFPDGTGALTDSALNALLTPRIQETRNKWDPSDAAALVSGAHGR